jgi:hypothetical protein
VGATNFPSGGSAVPVRGWPPEARFLTGSRAENEDMCAFQAERPQGAVWVAAHCGSHSQPFHNRCGLSLT